MVDLTEELAPCRRHSMGRWSLSDSRCGGFVLSRVVGPDELDRNTTRIPAFGWCGYLSLEWAERQSRGVGGDGLNLRLSNSRERMTSFVGGLLRGCIHDAVCRKLLGLLARLRDAACPWRLDRASGLWMDVSDVQHMCLPFPVVLWGQDTGSGRRRVMCPPRGNGVVSLAWAEEVMRSPAQLVLDSAHFFPLDAVPEGLPAIIGTLMLHAEGLLSRSEDPGLANTSVEGLSPPGGTTMDAGIVPRAAPGVGVECPAGVPPGDTGVSHCVVATLGVLGTRASEAPVREGMELQSRSSAAWGGEGLELRTPPGDVVERKPGTKWRATRIDEWLVRRSSCSRDLVVRKKCELVSLAGVKRQSVPVLLEDRRRRRRKDGSWEPGAEAEPPD